MYYVIFPYDSQVWTTSSDECIVPAAFLLNMVNNTCVENKDFQVT